ncbi:MAG: hypothetical protein RR250_02915 [Akkermansia sp.]
MAGKNTYTITGNDIIFGTDQFAVPWGVVTSCKPKESKERKEYPGKSGNTATVVSWGYKEVVSLDILLVSDTSEAGSAAKIKKPAQDDHVSMGGKVYIVTGVDTTYTQDDAGKMTVELTYWPEVCGGLSVPAAVSAQASLPVADGGGNLTPKL